MKKDAVPDALADIVTEKRQSYKTTRQKDITICILQIVVQIIEIKIFIYDKVFKSKSKLKSLSYRSVSDIQEKKGSRSDFKEKKPDLDIQEKQTNPYPLRTPSSRLWATRSSWLLICRVGEPTFRGGLGGNSTRSSGLKNELTFIKGGFNMPPPPPPDYFLNILINLLL